MPATETGTPTAIVPMLSRVTPAGIAPATVPSKVLYGMATEADVIFFRELRQAPSKLSLSEYVYNVALSDGDGGPVPDGGPATTKVRTAVF